MVNLTVLTVITILFFVNQNFALNNPIRPIQIFQLIPQNEHQLLRLIQLYETGNLDFWRAPTKVNATVDLMVDGRQKKQIENFTKNYKIPGKIIVEDLEKMLEEKEGDKNWRFKALKMLQNGKKDILDVPDNRKENFGMDMTDYHGYDEIVNWMRKIEQRMPNNAKIFSIGKSVEGKNIWGIKLANPVESTTKHVVWIDGGIHAREWTSVFTTTYLIYNLANGILQNDAKLLKILETIEIVVFPVLNPDGYEYTRSDPRNALVRMWRKNRSNERCATNKNGEKSCCKGVDLNRNFDYRFAETGTSFHPCSEIYHGAGAFSEPETRAVRDAILSSELTGRISAFISLHAYSQLWIYPYSNKKQNYPADVADLKKVAQKAVNAIGKLFGTRYLYGTGPETIYAYTGGSCDWAKETAKIKYSYTLELRPSYFYKDSKTGQICNTHVSAWNGFVLDKTQLIPTARETFDGIFVVLETAAQEASGKPAGNVRSLPAPPTPVIPRKANPLFVPAVPKSTIQSENCRDTVEDCARWLFNNPRLCATSKNAMKSQCPLSCGFC